MRFVPVKNTSFRAQDNCIFSSEYFAEALFTTPSFEQSGFDPTRGSRFVFGQIEILERDPLHLFFFPLFSARPREQQEADCPPPGSRDCSIGKHQGPARVLKHLAWLTARYTAEAAQEKLTYLQKREAHMGVTDLSGNRLSDRLWERRKWNLVVVEARLKGASIHWHRHNVNPHAGVTQCGL
jgi:hypothetical protein